MMDKDFSKSAADLITVCRDRGFSDSAIEAIGIICCSEQMNEVLGSSKAGLTRVTEYAKTAYKAEDVMSFAHKLASGEIQ